MNLIKKAAGGLAAVLLLVACSGAGPARADASPDPRRVAAPSATPTAVPGPPFTFLAVGDSITAGCMTDQTNWCAQLASAIQDGSGRPVTFGVAAVSGATCGGVKNTMDQQLAAQAFDLVIINCGTNSATSTQAGRDQLAQEWRALVEDAHAHGALVLPTLIQYSDPEVNTAQGRSWLVPNEVQANDVLFSNWHFYDGAGWFAGKLDLQQIPGDRDYTDSLGIHPNELGKATMAALTYLALAPHYGWLMDHVRQPCGMWGHRPDPAYLQYIHFTPCVRTW